MKIGYARVSTYEQTHDLQIDALRQYGCAARHIFTDTCSGSVACAERPQLRRLCEQLREGDVLVVWNLDRLGRDLRDLLDFVDGLGQQGIGFVSLTQEWANTTSPMGTFLFQVFGGLAELERKRISERTKAGLAAARARGRKGGRKRKVTPEQLDRAAELMRARQLTVREIARTVGLAPNTLYRYLTPDGERRGDTPPVAA
jgi:DNA invertase Pin-like site-specific DNA recombinase